MCTFLVIHFAVQNMPDNPPIGGVMTITRLAVRDAPYRVGPSRGSDPPVLTHPQVLRVRSSVTSFDGGRLLL